MFDNYERTVENDDIIGTGSEFWGPALQSVENMPGIEWLVKDVPRSTSTASFLTTPSQAQMLRSPNLVKIGAISSKTHCLFDGRAQIRVSN